MSQTVTSGGQRVQLSQVQALPDLISTENFLFNLGNLPNVGDASILAIKCAEAVIPGFSNESYQAMLHGATRNFRGRKMYPRVMTITYLEDSQLNTFNTLRNWHEIIVGTNSMVSGGGIADYSVQPTLVIFDQAGNAIDSIDFVNCYLQDVPDVQTSGESSTLMRITATLHYDYPIFSGVSIL